MGKVSRANIRDYIDYYALKNFIINACKTTGSTGGAINKDSQSEQDLAGHDINIGTPNSGIIISSPKLSDCTDNEQKTDFVTQFLAMLDIEIKKVYHLFTSKERELYVSINSHLHSRSDYENFTVKQITKELDELWRISLFALNITKFVSYNIKALKTVLNKFDKHFEKNYGQISSVCARNIIQSKNKDLLYILQFKVFIFIYPLR
jgi:hypothetical protein